MGEATGVQIAVTIRLTFGSPANPMADQPLCSVFGVDSNEVATLGLLVVAPPPITFIPLGQVAVADVPGSDSGVIATVDVTYWTVWMFAALMPVSVVWLICVAPSEPDWICVPEIEPALICAPV